MKLIPKEFYLKNACCEWELITNWNCARETNKTMLLVKYYGGSWKQKVMDNCVVVWCG